MILLTVLLIILAILIILAGAFVVIPLEFGLEIDKTANNTKIYLCFKVFKIPFRIRLNDKDDKKERKKQAEKREKFSFRVFLDKVETLKEVYRDSKVEIRHMLSYAREHLSINRVDFRIHFGFDNAATTGISTGVAWGAGSFILKVIDEIIGIKKINMQVDPDFNNKIFEIYSKTILIMRPIHFIIIYRRIVKTYKYVKNKINNKKGGA